MAIHEKRYDATVSGIRISSGFRQDHSTPAHWHSEAELCLVKEGSICYNIDSVNYTLETGDLIFCPCGSIHSLSSSASSNIQVILFHPEVLQMRLPLENTRPILVKKQDIEADLFKLISVYFNEIDTELTLENMYYRTMSKSYLVLLMGTLLRNFYPDFNDRSPQDGVAKILMQQAISYIEEYYTEDISAADLAKHLNISQSYLARLFSKSVGLSFRNYLNGIRIQSAVELICTTNMSFADVAYNCGFNSIRTFNRVFYSTYGCNPSDYRESKSSEH